MALLLGPPVVLLQLLFLMTKNDPLFNFITFFYDVLAYVYTKFSFVPLSSGRFVQAELQNNTAAERKTSLGVQVLHDFLTNCVFNNVAHWMDCELSFNVQFPFLEIPKILVL